MAELHHRLTGRGLGDPALRAWVRAQPTLEQVWSQCPRGDWLLAMASGAEVRRKLVVAAARECALAAAQLQLGSELAPRQALVEIERWVDGSDNAQACADAGLAAATTANRLQRTEPRAAHAANAVAHTAFACGEGATANATGHHAVQAAAYAARAWQDMPVDGDALCAEIVREHIPVDLLVGRRRGGGGKPEDTPDRDEHQSAITVRVGRHTYRVAPDDEDTGSGG